MPTAVKIVRNPNDPEQYVILMNTGNILERGNNPPPPFPQDEIEDHTAGNAPVVPDADSYRQVYSIIVTDWSDPSGYVGTNRGEVYEFGNAAPATIQPWTSAGGYLGFIDLIMDPAANGEGYFLGRDGDIRIVGSAVGIQSVTTPGGIAQRIYMPDWATRSYWVMDEWGRFFPRHFAVPISVGGFPPEYPLWQEAVTMGAHIKDASGAGWLATRDGFVAPLNGAQDPAGWQRLHVVRSRKYSDFVVFDDGSGDNPFEYGLLTIFSTVDRVTASSPPRVVVAGPTDPETTTTRPDIVVGYQDDEGDAMQAAQLRIFPDSVYSVGGTDEVQTLQLTGSPASGTVTLGVTALAGLESVVVPFNSSAAALQTQLEGLQGINAGDVAVTGGPWPATITVTFQGRLADHNWPPIRLLANNLAGGTSPTLAVATPTPGVGIDPETTDAFYEDNFVAEDRDRRIFETTIDFPDGRYRAYVRVQDTSDLWSPWAYWEWEQDVTLPATPVLIPVLVGELGDVQLDVTVSAVTADAVAGVQFRDDESLPWQWVIDGWQLGFDGFNHAMVTDHTAPYGQTRCYRAVQYVPDPVLVGLFSDEECIDVPIPECCKWSLVDPFGTAGGMPLHVNGDIDEQWEREVKSRTDWPDGRPEATVMTSGGPRSRVFPLEVYTLTQGEHDQLEFLLGATRRYVLRDFWGNAFFVKLTGNPKYRRHKVPPGVGETTPIGHNVGVTLPLTQVARPVAGPTTGSLALIF